MLSDGRGWIADAGAVADVVRRTGSALGVQANMLRSMMMSPKYKLLCIGRYLWDCRPGPA